MHTPNDLSTATFVKTTAGATEIRLRAQPISRAARDLLFVIDGSRNVAAWAVLIHGTTLADIRQLIESGLIANTQPQTQTQALARPLTAAEAIATLSHDQLYGLLTSQARVRLGLIRGCKLILATERCACLSQLQELASRFLLMVRKTQGEEAANRMLLALGVAG